MPHEGDIEFKIELQPDAAPIAKSLYRMTQDELAELKIQLKNLLDKLHQTKLITLGLSCLVCEEDG
jgi:hypothetical protein